jgi:hypothetical protein
MPPKKPRGKTRRSTDSKGKERAKTTFSQAEIDTAQNHFPPVLTPTNPKENSLVSIANNWGIKVLVEGDKGAKNPVTSRSIMNTFSALSVYQQQPEDNFWTDILEREKNSKYRFLNSIISKYSDIITSKLNCTKDEIYSYVRICALTGLPFIPGIDSQDLDHCESAKRTGEVGLPITSQNCSAGHVWESAILVASTLSSANRSAGESSYFTSFQKLSLGPLSMLINEKATLAISADFNSCCMKHPFHEFRRMIPGDIKSMIDVVYKSQDTSPFLKEIITTISSNIDEYIKNHISNLKLWPTLKDILRVMNRELYKDMKSLFTESRIDLQERTKIKDSMSDITSLPTLYEVETSIDFSDTESLNHAKLYILKPFGFIHALAFLGDRYEKLEGTQFQRVLETIYGIGERRNLNIGKHDVSAYAMAERASEPKMKIAPPPPPPPLPKLDLNNVEQLDVIQRNIANWLGTHPIEHGEFYNDESGAINRIADRFLHDFNLSEIYNISSARNLTIKNMVKDLLLIVHHAGNYNGNMRHLKDAVDTAIQHIDDMPVESKHNIMDEGSSPPDAVVLADSQFPVGRLSVFETHERRARANARGDLEESPPSSKHISSENKLRFRDKPPPQPYMPAYDRKKLLDADPLLGQMALSKKLRKENRAEQIAKKRERKSKSRSPDNTAGGKRKTRKNRR